jgi:hypothetical protein
MDPRADLLKVLRKRWTVLVPFQAEGALIDPTTQQINRPAHPPSVGKYILAIRGKRQHRNGEG